MMSPGRKSFLSLGFFRWQLYFAGIVTCGLFLRRRNAGQKESQVGLPIFSFFFNFKEEKKKKKKKKNKKKKKKKTR